MMSALGPQELRDADVDVKAVAQKMREMPKNLFVVEWKAHRSALACGGTSAISRTRAASGGVSPQDVAALLQEANDTEQDMKKQIEFLLDPRFAAAPYAVKPRDPAKLNDPNNWVSAAGDPMPYSTENSIPGRGRI